MRRQLPVYSPLGPGQILSAAVKSIIGGKEERSRLTAQLRDRFSAESIFLTASGTQALQLILRHAPAIGPGGPVVALPGYSCYDLVTAAVGAGVRVRFYDVDPDTLTPDLDSVREVLRAGVSAVVAGNLYGYPLSWGALQSECEAAGVALVEDAAQGVGTVSDEGPGGTLGQATILSFGRGKGWTGGGGGALMLRDVATDWIDGAAPRLATGTRGARNLATTTAAWALGRPGLYRIPTSIPGLGLGETHYHEPTPVGTISDFSAALARGTADVAMSVAAQRRRTAKRLADALEAQVDSQGGSGICQPIGGFESATFLRLPIVMDGPGRAASAAAAGRDLGIATGYPRPLSGLPQVEALLDEAPPPLPGSERLASSLVTLPTHQWVRSADEEALRRLFRP